MKVLEEVADLLKALRCYACEDVFKVTHEERTGYYFLQCGCTGKQPVTSPKKFHNAEKYARYIYTLLTPTTWPKQWGPR